MFHIPSEFWKQKPLNELTHKEWEALCDGCAKCCLHRLEDEDTQEIQFTNVVCRLLDPENGKCTKYGGRSTLVPTCVTMTIKDLENPYWLPSTCAYRLLAEGKELPDWHPLVSGNQYSVFNAGHSVLGRAICETKADELEYHMIDWVY
ncbi:UPF0260 protein YcgN [hydrothermal vent metagenome]|uniref:UPF0260 protein YcgN n=1 Tax=hydrothermal vent metagenome TaxID=652676 RepID=A0A3B1AM19_9ZZZZ